MFHEKVMEEWITTERTNRSFPVFMRYELRHCIKGRLTGNAREKEVDLLLATKAATELLNRLERTMYKKNRKLGIAYINITKLIWRMRGYPRVEG